MINIELTMQRKVQVAVPKTGKRQHWSMGVYVPDIGIINVEMPIGVTFGDEFEVSYPSDREPRPCQVVRVPVPYNIKPGMTFQHRVPNGKQVLVSCPPNAHDDSILEIPWSDIANSHYIVQAHVVLKEPEIQSKPKPAAYSQHQRNQANNPKTQPRGGGFRTDDIELARALSLTTLQGPGHLDEDIMLERALKASMEENVPKHLLAQQSTYTPKHRHQTSSATTNADHEEQRMLDLATNQSLKQAKSVAASVSKDVTWRNPSSTLSSPSSLEPKALSDMDEDEIERMIMEQSLREAEEHAARLNGLQQDTQTLNQYSFPNKVSDQRHAPSKNQPYL